MIREHEKRNLCSKETISCCGSACIRSQCCLGKSLGACCRGEICAHGDHTVCGSHEVSEKCALVESEYLRSGSDSLSQKRIFLNAIREASIKTSLNLRKICRRSLLGLRKNNTVQRKRPQENSYSKKNYLRTMQRKTANYHDVDNCTMYNTSHSRVLLPV